MKFYQRLYIRESQISIANLLSEISLKERNLSPIISDNKSSIYTKHIFHRASRFSPITQPLLSLFYQWLRGILSRKFAWPGLKFLPSCRTPVVRPSASVQAERRLIFPASREESRERRQGKYASRYYRPIHRSDWETIMLCRGWKTALCKQPIFPSTVLPSRKVSRRVQPAIAISRNDIVIFAIPSSFSHFSPRSKFNI